MGDLQIGRGGHRQKPSRPDRPEQGTSQGGALGHDPPPPNREDNTRLTTHSGLYTMVTRGFLFYWARAWGQMLPLPFFFRTEACKQKGKCMSHPRRLPPIVARTRGLTQCSDRGTQTGEAAWRPLGVRRRVQSGPTVCPWLLFVSCPISCVVATRPWHSTSTPQVGLNFMRWDMRGPLKGHGDPRSWRPWELETAPS